MRKRRKPAWKATETQAWYAWALQFRDSDPEVRQLPRDAREGLQAARELARNARERSETALNVIARGSDDDLPPGVYRLKGHAPLREDQLPYLLSPADLAEAWETPQTVRAKIEAARVGLFGRELSRSGIYYRLKQRRERGGRTCAEPDCDDAIPAQAHGRIRYCAAHGSGAARARRHRAAAARERTPSHH